jgi:hypothetical protein
LLRRFLDTIWLLERDARGLLLDRPISWLAPRLMLLHWHSLFESSKEVSENHAGCARTFFFFRRPYQKVVGSIVLHSAQKNRQDITSLCFWLEIQVSTFDKNTDPICIIL